MRKNVESWQIIHFSKFYCTFSPLWMQIYLPILRVGKSRMSHISYCDRLILIILKTDSMRDLHHTYISQNWKIVQFVKSTYLFTYNLIYLALANCLIKITNKMKKVPALNFTMVGISKLICTHVKTKTLIFLYLSAHIYPFISATYLYSNLRFTLRDYISRMILLFETSYFYFGV